MPHPGQLHIVAATCIVVRNGQILIVKRSDREVAYPGKWTVPGGKLDRADYEARPRDTKDAWLRVLEVTVRREVQEEANLEIGKPTLLTDFVFIRPDNQAVLGFSFWADWISGEAKISDDFTDFAWIEPADARSYDMIEGIPAQIEEVGQLIAATTE